MDLIVAVTLMVPPETGSIEGEIINEVISGGVEFCWATGVWVVGVGVGVGCAFDTTFTDGKVENTGLKPFPSIGPAKLRAYIPRGAVCGITIDPEPLPLASGEMILLKLTPPGPKRVAITFGLAHPELDVTVKVTDTPLPTETEVGDNETFEKKGALEEAMAL